jgi:hypothetical protein
MRWIYAAHKNNHMSVVKWWSDELSGRHGYQFVCRLVSNRAAYICEWTSFLDALLKRRDASCFRRALPYVRTYSLNISRTAVKILINLNIWEFHEKFLSQLNFHLDWICLMILYMQTSHISLYVYRRKICFEKNCRDK